jgi:uncharacterized protein YtpQ (UPF0354 family)
MLLHRYGIAASLALASAMALQPLAHAQTKTLEEEVYIALKAKPANGEVILDRDKGLITIGQHTVSLDNIKKQIEQIHLEGQAAMDYAVTNVETLLKESRDLAKPLSWVDVKGRILPTVSPVEYQKVAQCLPLSILTSRCYVVDNDNSRAFVTPKDMAAWGVQQGELQTSALENLQKISPTTQFRLNVDGDQVNLVISAKRDSYDAARILLPDVQSFIRKVLKGDALVAVPNRDFLIAWRVDTPNRQILAARVVQDFQQQPHPLTYELFMLDAKGLRPATEAEALGGD